jgi:hypothetical protein
VEDVSAHTDAARRQGVVGVVHADGALGTAVGGQRSCGREWGPGNRRRPLRGAVGHRNGLLSYSPLLGCCWPVYRGVSVVMDKMVEGDIIIDTLAHRTIARTFQEFLTCSSKHSFCHGRQKLRDIQSGALPAGRLLSLLGLCRGEDVPQCNGTHEGECVDSLEHLRPYIPKISMFSIQFFRCAYPR